MTVTEVMLIAGRAPSLNARSCSGERCVEYVDNLSCLVCNPFRAGDDHGDVGIRVQVWVRVPKLLNREEEGPIGVTGFVRVALET